MPAIILRKTDEMLPEVERILDRLAERLRVILPDEELLHIGGTAVPGAITKGDIDVALRIPIARFAPAVETLRKHFAVKQSENWTAEFASFGDDASYGLPVGIQVAIKDSAADFLVYLRDYLIANRQALAEYNALKLAHAKNGRTDYWQAKHEFFAKILSEQAKLPR